jgi:hypothetical protein
MRKNKITGAIKGAGRKKGNDDNIFNAGTYKFN